MYNPIGYPKNLLDGVGGSISNFTGFLLTIVSLTIKVLSVSTVSSSPS